MVTDHDIAAWRHPDADAHAGHSIDHYRELAQTAERGLFDLVFVADSPGDWDGDREIRSRISHSAHFEPVTLWSALSQVTHNIGFVATASTTYEDPYLLARKFASLDHISKGRADHLHRSEWRGRDAKRPDRLSGAPPAAMGERDRQCSG